MVTGEVGRTAIGWATFYGGKYLNTYAKDKDGVKHVPPGAAASDHCHFI